MYAATWFFSRCLVWHIIGRKTTMAVVATTKTKSATTFAKSPYIMHNWWHWSIEMILHLRIEKKIRFCLYIRPQQPIRTKIPKNLSLFAYHNISHCHQMRENRFHMPNVLQCQKVTVNEKLLWLCNPHAHQRGSAADFHLPGTNFRAQFFWFFVSTTFFPYLFKHTEMVKNTRAKRNPYEK